MSKQEDKDLSKPTPIPQSNAPKEPSAYTPPWMSSKERSKLKARIMEIKKKEEMYGMKKEEGILVQKSPARKSKDEGRTLESSHGEALRAEDVMKRNDSTTAEEYGDALGHQESALSKEPSLAAHSSSTPKKGESKKSKKSKSKENLSRNKSKEELMMAKKPKAKHPKAAHANPSGNVVENEPPWIPHPRDTIEAHLWATDYRNFDPELYSFKSPEKLSTKKPIVAECPPFWVLNDHTIAVAWKMFRTDADKSDLGIVALQWSREFLSQMKDERGEYPSAIKHLLDVIEDGLILRYSRAAEDSKKAHQKDNDISYASSDSVFKPPSELSYTLKDILSRNFPGRKFSDAQEGSIVRKDDRNATVVNKTTLLPLSVLGEGEILKQTDLVALLKQCKIEQEARIKHEINASKEIERLLKHAQEGKLPVQSDRKDHVGFDVPGESEPSLTSPKRKKKYKKDADVKKTTSDTSNTSEKSDVSRKSAASLKFGTPPVPSGISGKSLDSIGSAGSDYSTMSGDSAGSSNSKAKRMKKSKNNVTKRKSKDSTTSKESQAKNNVTKRKSKDSITSKKSQGSASSKKKKPKGRKGSRENIEKKSSRSSKGSIGGAQV